MKKCPRCKLPNQNERQCDYCGLVFDEFRKADRFAGLRRLVVPVIFIFAAGLAVAGYWFYSNEPLREKATKVADNQPGNTRNTADSELKKVARELSGGSGLLERATEGTSRGSLIAVVVFSVVGIGYLTYGKKSQQLFMVICGIALMGYSYFVNGTLLIVLIGVGLSVLPFAIGLMGVHPRE